MIDEKRIYDSIRNKLKEFPLYNENHGIMITDRRKNGFSAVYFSKSHDVRVDQNYFDIQVKGNIGWIHRFFIEKKFARNGHGRKLYEIVEKFFEEEGVELVCLEAAMEGIYFWPKMGFGDFKGKDNLNV